MTRLALLLTFGAFACTQAQAPTASGPAQKSPTPAPTSGVVRAEEVAKGLDHPWALEFLPDGRMLVTERPGHLRIVSQDGSISAPLSGVPAVRAQGQGGLLDVALDPAFARNRTIYLSYAEPGEGGAGTAVARGVLGAAGLSDVRVIWRQSPKVSGGNHFGSRLVFDREGRLFVTMGDRFAHRDRAQDLGSEIGKVVRIHTDGRIPTDNPFVGRSGARPAIWSYGHRNSQGAALHPETGELWIIEHGPRGGDELQPVRAGRNYGWPAITYGINYDGSVISSETAREGMEQPVYYWNPVIAPSGLAFYTADAIPGWKGSILIGSLNPGGLVRLTMSNGRVTREERHLTELRQRFRDVKQGPDGFIYVITDSGNGSVLRIRPAAR